MNIMENALEKVAIESLIYEVRGQKVMLDRDLARLYGVETKVLNQAGQHLKYMPHVFTEQGVAMLSCVLKSDTAEVEAIKAKLELLERKDEDNLKAINDLSEDMRQEIDTIYQAIAALSVKETAKPEPPRKKIGFK